MGQRSTTTAAPGFTRSGQLTDPVLERRYRAQGLPRAVLEGRVLTAVGIGFALLLAARDLAGDPAGGVWLAAFRLVSVLPACVLFAAPRDADSLGRTAALAVGAYYFGVLPSLLLLPEVSDAALARLFVLALVCSWWSGLRLSQAAWLAAALLATGWAAVLWRGEATASALVSSAVVCGGGLGGIWVIRRSRNMAGRQAALELWRTVALIEGRGTLLSAVAHRLSAPLDACRERLRRVPAAPRARRATLFAETDEDLEGLADTIRQVMLLGSLLPGDTLDSDDPVDVAGLVAELAPVLAARHPEVELRVASADGALVFGDAALVRTAVLDLMEWVMRQAPHACSIRVASDGATGVRLSFESDGPRAGSVAEQAPLGGAGVALATRVFEAHGGALTLGTSAHGGVRVEAWLGGAR